MNLKDKIKVVAFDADDTLWDNQTSYDMAEAAFCSLLSEYGDAEAISSELFKIEMKNMPVLGYGAKAVTISMIEAAIHISGGKVTTDTIEKIIGEGKSLLNNPATPLEGVRETLEALHRSGKYRLIVITKGDLLDQENKLDRSGLTEYFEHIEIVSEKTEKAYSELLDLLCTKPDELLMVGNSFKSDIAPVLNLGGYGVHIPFKSTWQHEVTEEFDHPHLIRTGHISTLLDILL